MGRSSQAKASAVRERILDTSYRLFCRHGVRAVGVDTIVDESGVAKMSVYRHFGSKSALVVAALERREQRWTEDWLHAEIARRAEEPAEQMLAVFDVFDDWFHKRSFEGCLFINVLLEVDDRRDPAHAAARRHLANIRAIVEDLARRAGATEPDHVARQWHILMKGSIVAATEGDVDAARRAREMGELLLGSLLPDRSAPPSTTRGRPKRRPAA